MGEEIERISTEEKISGTKVFIQQVGVDRTAEFIVALQESVDGLTRNNEDFVIGFKELYEKNSRAESSLKDENERLRKVLANTADWLENILPDEPETGEICEVQQRTIAVLRDSCKRALEEKSGIRRFW